MPNAMWKPGSAKPGDDDTSSSRIERKSSKKKNKDRCSAANSDSVGGTNEKKSSAGGISQLSDVTRNMRFMKRKLQTQTSPTPKKSAVDRSQTKDDEDMDIDNEHVNNESIKNTPQHAGQDSDDESQNGEYNPPFLKATPADMYGMQATILGRRSFGGFNKNVAECWYLSHQSSSSLAAGPMKDGKPVSDEELLKRYAEHVRHGRPKNAGDRPIGNLQKKPKKKSHISNQTKKRGFDELMK